MGVFRACITISLVLLATSALAGSKNQLSDLVPRYEKLKAQSFKALLAIDDARSHGRPVTQKSLLDPILELTQLYQDAGAYQFWGKKEGLSLANEQLAILLKEAGQALKGALTAEYAYQESKTPVLPLVRAKYEDLFRIVDGAFTKALAAHHGP